MFIVKVLFTIKNLLLRITEKKVKMYIAIIDDYNL